MNKRAKYILSSLVTALTFYFFLNLPFETRYYGLMVGIVLIVFCFWFGLGIMFEESVYTRLMSILLPVGSFVGFGLFASILPLNTLSRLVLSVIFGIGSYTIFLVENVFLVAIGYRTVPLYRAAYTVSLIMLLLMSFFLFNSLFSFRASALINSAVVMFISSLIFSYQFWAISIELPDDGKKKNKLAYILLPSWLLTELYIVLSFWPVGLFKGSIYLVAAIYVISGLLQSDIRDRLFRRVWLSQTWIGVAVIAGMILMARWR